MDTLGLEKGLRKYHVNEDIIQQILKADYKHDANPKQDDVNYFSVAMAKCEELLDMDVLSNVMLERACCKSGQRLENSKRMAKEDVDKPLEEKLIILSQQKYMGTPKLTKNGDIFTGGCAGTVRDGKITCTCWRFSGCVPIDRDMPLSYCLCCAGHFRFHYQKALGLKLRVKEIVSSAFHDHTKPCSFLFEIMNQ